MKRFASVMFVSTLLALAAAAAPAALSNRIVTSHGQTDGPATQVPPRA